jgi:GAF domain-containing protein
MTIPGTNAVMPETDFISQLRIRYIRVLAQFAIVLGTIGLAVAFLASDYQRMVLALPIVIISIITLYLVRAGHMRLASLLTISIYVIATFFTDFDGWFTLACVMALLSAATLVTTPVFVLTNIIIFVKFFLNINQLVASSATIDVFLIIGRSVEIAALMVVSIVTRYIMNQTQRASLSADASTRLLQSVAEAGQTLTKILDVEELLPSAVELIRSRFGFYHAQIFLVDEDGARARLVASTGATGQKLLAQKHQLAVGSQSVIGRVTSTGQPVIARSTDPVYYRNELLPETRAELALPILDGSAIIGALDVQSRESTAFDPEITQALQVMANQLGTSIRNARLFEVQAQNARETKRLFLEAETNLREIQQMNQQLTKVGWEHYLLGKRETDGVTLLNDRFVADTSWTASLTQAAQTRQSVSDSQSGVISVPVMLGGEVIGAIEVESDSTSQIDESVEMVKAVAQRLAISLDKARLFEESQEATAREQRINDIVARYQTINSVDDLLRVTLSELSQTLGAKHGAIRLGVSEPQQSNGEHGS